MKRMIASCIFVSFALVNVNAQTKPPSESAGIVGAQQSTFGEQDLVNDFGASAPGSFHGGVRGNAMSRPVDDLNRAESQHLVAQSMLEQEKQEGLEKEWLQQLVEVERQLAESSLELHTKTQVAKSGSGQEHKEDGNPRTVTTMFEEIRNLWADIKKKRRMQSAAKQLVKELEKSETSEPELGPVTAENSQQSTIQDNSGKELEIAGIKIMQKAWAEIVGCFEKLKQLGKLKESAKEVEEKKKLIGEFIGEMERLLASEKSPASEAVGIDVSHEASRLPGGSSEIPNSMGALQRH